MSYTQLVTPNPNIPCRPGYCLQYVQTAFAAGWSGATATAGWNLCRHKHADTNFPSDVAVPVWFSLADEPAGHVALRMPDGSYYSTSHPTNTTPYHHPNLQHLLNYYSGRLSLRGWSEDLNGTQLITVKEEQPMTDKNYVTAFFIDLFATTPNDSQINQYVGRPFPEVYNELRSSKARQDYLAYMKQVVIDANSRAEGVIRLQKEQAEVYMPIVESVKTNLGITTVDPASIKKAVEDLKSSSPAVTELKPGLYRAK